MICSWRFLSLIGIQLYKLVFTSPSSSSGSLDESRPQRTRTRTSRAVRGPVASILRMEKQVTIRSIAYICILVRGKQHMCSLFQSLIHCIARPILHSQMRRNGNATITVSTSQQCITSSLTVLTLLPIRIALKSSLAGGIRVFIILA